MKRKRQTLKPDELSRVARLYARLAPLSVEARREALEAEAGDDPILREEVEKLLGSKRLEGFIEKPVIAVFAGDGRDAAEKAAASPLRAGQRLGNYQVLRRLSAGGMGAVYEAHDTVLDRRVALKTIIDEALGDPSMVERFKIEAKLLAQLNHPKIVTIYSLGAERGLHYIAMELVQGETLQAILQRGPLSLEKALAWFRDLTLAVRAAHEAGIIHRDLKPSNILIGKDGTLKLTDFGIARRRVSEETKGLTRTGMILGTINYMAPELFDGKEASVQSDIYALGLILYQLVTGRLPHVGKDEFETLEALRNLTFPPPSRFAPELSPELDAIILKMCAKDPAFRYASLLDLERDPRSGALSGTRAVRLELAGDPRDARIGTRTPPPPAVSSSLSRGAPLFAEPPLIEQRRAWLVTVPLWLIAIGLAVYMAKRVTGRGPAPYPAGIYVVWRPDTPLPRAGLRARGFVGVLLQVLWSEVEPERGRPNWKDVDARLAEAEAAGLKVSVAVIADLARTPAWLRNDPRVKQVELLSIHPPLREPCRLVSVPVFWDPVYRAEKSRFIRELGRRYADRPAVVAVSASFANFNSDVWWLPAEPAEAMKQRCGKAFDNLNQWLQAGASEERMRQAGEEILDVTARAFPRQAIKLPVAAVSDGLRSLASIGTLLEWGHARYGERFFPQINTFDTSSPGGETPDSSSVFGLLARYRPLIGFQMMADVTGESASRCLQNHGVAPCPAGPVLRASIAKALSYHPHFLEFLPADAANRELVDQFRETARALEESPF